MLNYDWTHTVTVKSTFEFSVHVYAPKPFYQQYYISVQQFQSKMTIYVIIAD